MRARCGLHPGGIEETTECFKQGVTEVGLPFYLSAQVTPCLNFLNSCLLDLKHKPSGVRLGESS